MTDTSPAAQWRVDLEDYVSVLELAPSGQLAVAGSLGGDVVLINPSDSSHAALERHEMGALSAAWSSDGTRLAVGGQDGLVRIYDSIGNPVSVVEMPSWVTTMAWSPNALLLAVGAGKRMTVADADGVVLDDFDDHASTVTAVAWSVDGRRVGTTSYSAVRWYEVVGKRKGRRKKFDFQGSILAMALSPDGKWACVGAQDSTIQLWKLWTGRQLAMGGYPSKIERLSFRPDSSWLAVACLGELTVWPFEGKGPRGSTPASSLGHTKHIEDLAWSPSGDLIVTTGNDGRTIVWDSPTEPGEELSVAKALESDVSTSRVRWLSEDALLLGRVDGVVVRLSL